MKNLKEFKPLIKLLGKEKTKLIIASILIFINGIKEMFSGYLNGAAIESITKMNLKLALIYLGTYLFIELTLDGFVVHYAYSMLYKIESILTRRLGFKAYKKALNLPAEAFEKHSSGEIINRITHDADTLSFAIGHLLQMFASMITSIIVFVYIVINSWIVALEIIVVLTVLFIIMKKYNPKIKETHKGRRQEQDKFASLTTESIRGIREIKTLGIKKRLIRDMKDIIKLIQKRSEDEIDLERSFNIITRFMRAFLEVGTFMTCAILLYYGNTTLTFFVAMTYYVYRYTWFIENLNDFTKTYQKTAVAIGRVNEITENKLFADEKFGKEKVKRKEGIIEFKNVTFAYPNEPATLKDFDIKFEPNKKIAIVGKSGQGKSTLFNIITRIFDTKEGIVSLDGININDLSEAELRSNISIIRQDPFIFNRSIKDNFKLVNPNITLKEIRSYAKLAYLDDYIMSLPKKYNTILGEGGVNLSGGQKQRLAIARTLSKKSKVILFDEATSALDNESQTYIKKAMDGLVKDHTIIIVAHRLSTIQDADIIYVVDKGKVAGCGTHNELLESNMIYQNLYHTESLNS